MQDNACITLWNPWTLFQPDRQSCPYGILVLNTFLNIPVQPNTLLDMWNKAIVRVTIDGGTNHWFKWLKQNHYTKFAEIDLIAGDMDSISKDLLDKYENSEHTKFVRTPDQDEIDFTKGLKELDKYLKEKNEKISVLIVLDDTSGRIDQIVANINTLFKVDLQGILPGVKIIKLSSNSLMWLLSKGKHKIVVPDCLIRHNSWCALMPVGQPCTLKTTGLKWNLDNEQLEFGKLISTSNTYSGEGVVIVETDKPIIWSMCIDNLAEEGFVV